MQPNAVANNSVGVIILQSVSDTSVLNPWRTSGVVITLKGCCNLSLQVKNMNDRYVHDTLN